MNKIFLLIFFVMNLGFLHSQNLVLNPDFEKSSSPNYDNLADWIKCILTDTPDYFTDSTTNKIFQKYIGGIDSYSGNSHVGLFVFRNKNKKNNETREYIQVPLNQKLEKNKIYYGEVFIASDAESNISCSSFGIYFSAIKIDLNKTTEMFKLKPQITNPFNNFIVSGEWTKLSGTFKANGTEKFLTLGNFNSDAHTKIRPVYNKQNKNKKQKWNIDRKETVAYFYIDNVTVFLKDTAKTAKIVSTDTIPTINISELTNTVKEELVNETKQIPIIIEIPDSIKFVGETLFFKEQEDNGGIFLEGTAIILSNIHFEYNKSEFKDSAVIELNSLLQFMRKNSSMEIEIRGHTDNIGNKEYNNALSLARAKAVKKFLIDNEINKERISSYGYGDTQAIANNETKEGRAKNRRVEFIIIRK